VHNDDCTLTHCHTFWLKRATSNVNGLLKSKFCFGSVLCMYPLLVRLVVLNFEFVGTVLWRVNIWCYYDLVFGVALELLYSSVFVLWIYQ